MDYKNIIPKLKSIRDYKDIEVSDEILKELKKTDNYKKLMTDIDIELIILNNKDAYEKLEDEAGYFGIMIKAPHYIFILSDEKEHYVENAGYIGQQINLKAFELGVGSCWITFKNGEKIKELLNITSDKALTGIIALGFDDNKNKVIYENVSEYNPSKAEIEIVEDNVSYRLGVQDVAYIESWGNNATVDELMNRGLFDAIRYSRLAPSTKNRQPWRFLIDNETVILALKSDSFANEYEEKIELGIVMFYFKSIIDSTMFEMTWNFGNLDGYEIPDDYKIVAHCTV